MIDLHIHTNATPHHSSWDPAALAAHAASAGYRAIACTDHNTTASVAALLVAGKQHGLTIVPGVELDSSYGGKLWHTLVYGVAPDFPPLLALCAAVFSRNQADAIRLQDLLAERGYLLHGLDALGRPANVADVGTALARQQALPERQPGEDDEAAGMRYILTQVQNGYQPIGVDEIIAVAHAGGGLAVLAHPARSKGIYAVPITEPEVAALAATGLDGIEVWYPAHSPAQQHELQTWAARYHLVTTGGSDSHHPHQPLAQWPDAGFAAFFERLSASLV